MAQRKEFFYSVASVMVAVVAFLAIAEIVLRFLPVATGLDVQPVTTEDPIYHFAPNRSFVYSRDWDFAMVNTRRVNNDGWVNDQDYLKDDPRPLLAVVGDSYVEAQMVPYAETVEGRLAAALSGKMCVYSFAASGAPLSQYLIWAAYAVHEFGAEALMIMILPH